MKAAANSSVLIGLSTLYRIGGPQERYKTLRDTITDLAVAPVRRVRRLGQPTPPQETIWALQDVSFDLKYREVLGNIGRNAARKIALLKIVPRITERSSVALRITGGSKVRHPGTATWVGRERKRRGSGPVRC